MSLYDVPKFSGRSRMGEGIRSVVDTVIEELALSKYLHSPVTSLLGSPS
jgi:hypothetical protein